MENYDVGNSTDSALKRALFHECQYRTALLSDAMSFYDVNLTKDLIDSDFFYKDENGNLFSTLERIGMKAPCKFSDFVKKWTDVMVSPFVQEKFNHFENIRQTLLDAFAQGKRDYVVEYWAEPENGHKIYIKQRYLLVQSESGDICALGIVQDGTRIQKKTEETHQKELERFAYYDPITHGYNYIRFKQKLREIALPGAIVSMDIHSFKIVNTLSGILMGDKVIASIWNAVSDALEFENNDLAGHINGDHFIIFIPTDDEKIIVQKLKNITLALSIVSNELNVPSILPYFGIAKWMPGKKIELSYSEAVAAKSNAKNSEVQNYAFFNEQDTIRQIKEKVIIDSFEEAMAKKEFQIWYQPKYNPANHQLVGAEALVRWIKSDGTVISPGDFIPLFEKNGMIRPFDEYIFRNVCQQQSAWEIQGKKRVPVSINLSRISLYYQTVVEQYKRIAEEVGVDKSLLPIEITESAAVTNNEIKAIADKFYTAGFSLHMDDFGSGYSSLATLNILHFDTLKIDKSLVDYIGNFGGDRLLEHTISLAKDLGMHVTAEGVENENQVNFLRYIGCDSIQGYFFSRPLPVEKFELLLDEESDMEEVEDSDLINDHILKFKNSIIRPPLYTFIANLSTGIFKETSGFNEWRTETSFEGESYDDAVNHLSNFYIASENIEEYKDFMNRRQIVEHFKNKPQTKFLEYKRKYKDEEKSMRILAHIFKTADSNDVWMYCTISMID